MKLKSNFLTNYLGVLPENTNLLAIIYFVFLTSGMTSNILGAVMPDIKEAYKISYVMTGTAYSCHQIGNMIAAFAAGYLPYLLGRKKSTILMSSVMILGMILITLNISPLILLLAFIFTGLGRGTISNITNVVVSETTTNKTAGLSLLHAVYAVGALISPMFLILFSFVFAKSSWKFALLFIALCLIFSVYVLHNSKLKNEKEVAKKASDTKTVPFYKSIGYWINVTMLFLYQCSESGNIGWLVTYFKDSGIMAPSFAKISATILWLMILFGRITTATIGSKINKNKLLILQTVLNTLFFVLMISTQNMIFVVLGLLGTGFCMAGIYPTIFASMKDEYNSSTVAVGTIMGVGLIGASSMPILIGLVASKVTNSSLAQGLLQNQAEKNGVTSGISLIAVVLTLLVIFSIIKYFQDKKENNIKI